MADRVHHRDSPPVSPESDKPLPHPGTYVIQIPKDQVYRVPPPENASRYEKLARRSKRRQPCCVCLCWSLALLATFLLLSAVAAGVFYLVVKPESPKYSVNAITIRGLNLTTATNSSSSVQTVSPEFDVTVRADNPNNKIGIYYQKDSSVEIFYSDVRLSNGVLPSFYQPSNNVTVFQTALKGSGIELSGSVTKSLAVAEKRGDVRLNLKVRAPVKIKVGSVKTWKITIKVDCDLTVDKLTADAKIVSNNCDYSVDLW